MDLQLVWRTVKSCVYTLFSDAVGGHCEGAESAAVRTLVPSNLQTAARTEDGSRSGEQGEHPAPEKRIHSAAHGWHGMPPGRGRTWRATAGRHWEPSSIPDSERRTPVAPIRYSAWLNSIREAQSRKCFQELVRPYAPTRHKTVRGAHKARAASQKTSHRRMLRLAFPDVLHDDIPSPSRSGVRGTPTDIRAGRSNR